MSAAELLGAMREASQHAYWSELNRQDRRAQDSAPTNPPGR